MLSNLLKKSRVNSQMTLKDMALKTGYSQAYLSDIETGKKLPKNGMTLIELSKGYNVPYDTVLEHVMNEIKKEGR